MRVICEQFETLDDGIRLDVQVYQVDALSLKPGSSVRINGLDYRVELRQDDTRYETTWLRLVPGHLYRRLERQARREATALTHLPAIIPVMREDYARG